MSLNVTLRKRNTTTEYTIPLVSGSLVECLDFPSGSRTVTENGRTWNCNKFTNAGKIAITITGSGNNGSYTANDFFHTTLPALGLNFQNTANDIDDALEFGTVYDLIAPDQDNSQTYPRLFVSTTYEASQGRLQNIYTTNLRLQVESESSVDFSSWTSTSGEVQHKYCMPLVLENTLHQFIFGSFCYQHEFWSTGYIDLFRVEWTSSVTDQNWAEVSHTPGDKGFRPTASNTSKDVPGTGGRGTSNKRNPDYASQTISQPGEPDETKASAIGSGFINAYDITTANLLNVGKCLYSSTMLTMIANLFVNPLDAIISLNVFPYTPHIGTSESVRLLNHKCTLSDLGIEASGFPLTQQFRTVDFGSIHIPENWGNFLDYSDTTIELYLPFIGSIELDTSEAMNADINVQYTIDYFTGMCVANVQCSKTVVLPSAFNVPATSQHSYQGNCAIQIPLSAVDYGSMVGSLVGACATGLSNPAGGVMKLASDAVAGAWKPSVSTKGNIVANAGYCSVLYPYVRITRPITAEPDSYQDVMGYPSYINTTLGQCDDLCICDDIDLHTITGATPSELARIKQYCQNGVHV